MMPNEIASPEWAARIRAQYQALQAAGELAGAHHPVLRTMLETWERDSPKLWANLQKLDLAEPLAQVLLDRWFARRTELTNQGMAVTDAREQADRELLMLEPEEPETAEASPLAELEQVLQDSRQMVADFRAR